MIVFGLNPYGLTYHLGLQGAGGPRANPQGLGLEGFLARARELDAKAMEIIDPWLRAISDADLAALRVRLQAPGVTPIVSWGLMRGPFESALRSAKALGATTIRCGLTTVLCGDRAALGAQWPELVASVRTALTDYGPRVAAEGMMLAIESHQDFGSDELVDFCEGARNRHLRGRGQHLRGSRGADGVLRPRRAACAARPPQGLSSPVH